MYVDTVVLSTDVDARRRRTLSPFSGAAQGAFTASRFTADSTHTRRSAGMWKAKTIALVAALSLALPACGGDGGDDGVATLGDGENAAGASASPSVDPEDALAEFAECMRENGVEDFPDPQIDEDGGITIGIGGAEPREGAPSEVDRETLDAAMQECQPLLARGEGPGQISQEDRAAFQDAMIEYAQCMRDNGIEEFPDPEFTGDGGAMQQIGEGIDPNSDEFRQADETCRPILGETVPERGDGGEVTTDEGE
jgi:hypothetical protein